MKPFRIVLKSKKRFLRLLGEKGRGIALRSGLVTLKPGETIGTHITENKEEVILILEGTARVLYGKNHSLVARRQSFIYIPPNTRHDVKNIGKGILRYIYLTSSLV